MDAIKVGDVARIPPHGPPMTVMYIKGDMAEVTWYGTTNIKFGVYRANVAVIPLLSLRLMSRDEITEYWQAVKIELANAPIRRRKATKARKSNPDKTFIAPEEEADVRSFWLNHFSGLQLYTIRELAKSAEINFAQARAVLFRMLAEGLVRRNRLSQWQFPLEAEKTI